MAGEFDFIRWVRDRTEYHPLAPIGPGDDTAAIVPPASGLLLVTTDMLMDGVDFHVSEVDGQTIGRKAMAANVSDIAAMAGQPTAAVVSVALPRSGGRGLAEALHQGLSAEAEKYGIAIVGGDTNIWDQPLVISVTLLGHSTGRGPVPRSRASAGDWLFVTGPLGGSLLGRHLTPTPRVREAQLLHQLVELHALIDISDGLAGDLAHICEQSRCGAELDANAIPIHPDAVKRGTLTGQRALDHAIGDGEDFELLFAVSPLDGERLLAEQPVPGITLYKVGECVSEGMSIVEAGERKSLPPAGWVHEW